MKPRQIILSSILAVALVAAGLYAWWRVDLKWRPQTLAKHEAQIAALLEGSGWVSPGIGNGKALYLVGFRSCPDCIRFETEQYPLFQAAGVDTRTILFARRTNSTPEERATVAELWATRSWETWERWARAPIAAWKAPGIAPDTVPERAALVEKSRVLVEDLRPLLADNGLHLAFPLLVWRDEQGRLRGCACEKPRTYAQVRKELGL